MRKKKGQKSRKRPRRLGREREVFSTRSGSLSHTYGGTIWDFRQDLNNDRWIENLQKAAAEDEEILRLSTLIDDLSVAENGL